MRNRQIMNFNILSLFLECKKGIFYKWWPGQANAPKTFFCICGLLSYRYNIYQVRIEFLNFLIFWRTLVYKNANVEIFWKNIVWNLLIKPNPKTYFWYIWIYENMSPCFWYFPYFWRKNYGILVWGRVWHRPVLTKSNWTFWYCMASRSMD